jgi:tetratricopeptide (TPR) repeat protein
MKKPAVWIRSVWAVKLSVALLAVLLSLLLVSCAEPAEKYIERGDIYLARGQGQEAVAEYTIAIDRSPVSTDAYYKRGIAYRNSGSHDFALKDLNRAIELSPRFAPAYIARSLTYSLLNQMDLAMMDMDDALNIDNMLARDIDPDMAKAYFRLGAAYRQQGRMVPALAFISKTITLEPKVVEAYIERARIYLFKHRRLPT